MADEANKRSGMIGPSRDAWDPDLPPDKGSWVLRWRVPQVLKRLVPMYVARGIRDLKGRILARDFPRHKEFTQSPEDGQASACMSIVVPIHDAPEITRRCLASLEKYAPESEVILVDDGSKLDETLELIRQFGGRNGWKVARHEKPLGHSEACGAGARLATRSYLCLLNSDTVVTPWCWRRVKEAFEHDQKIGVAGPSTSVGGPFQVLTLATYLSPYWNDNQICAFAEQIPKQFQEPVVVDLPWVSGFAFFIRRSLWEQVGGFDPKLPDYGNEVELCNRITEKGFRIVWVRNSYIHHFGGQSYLKSMSADGIRARIRAAHTYIQDKKRSLVS
jgi:GT2 family glycosyltransferase